jgi:hypothetical protein
LEFRHFNRSADWTGAALFPLPARQFNVTKRTAEIPRKFATEQTPASVCPIVLSWVAENVVSLLPSSDIGMAAAFFLLPPVGSTQHYRRDAMPSKVRTLGGNRLIALLPRKQQQQFLAECEEVDLIFGEILSEEGDRIRHVYFPTGDSFISLMTRVEDNPNLEVGMVGSEGMNGISLMLGVDTSPLRTLVQGAGTALRIKAATFSRALENIPQLVQILNRYLYVLMSQLAQSAACTRFHVVEARLARWLLMTQDRSHSHQFHVTQEFLSYMLGVRRVGVTNAAGALHKQGLITYSRGYVTIIDRSGLEAASCACYKADIKSYKGALGELRTTGQRSYRVPGAAIEIRREKRMASNGGAPVA